LVEKWIPTSRSETVEIGKKTEGILGVKRLNNGDICMQAYEPHFPIATIYKWNLSPPTFSRIVGYG
jgi:hypothetical protein